MLPRKYAARRSFSPWQELEGFHHLAQAFNYPNVRVRPTFPTINVWTNDDGAIVAAKLPGLKPEAIDISVEGQTVTLAGQHEPAELVEGEQHLRRERRYGKFSRTLQLPFALDADKVEAKYEKGILHISLPRAEADKPKKITVKSA